MSSKSIFNELHFNDRRSTSRNAGYLNIYVHEEIKFFYHREDLLQKIKSAEKLRHNAKFQYLLHS